MSKFTAFSSAFAGVLAFAPWMVLLAGQSNDSVGWWAAVVVYPGAIAVLMLIVAVVRDVRARRYWALLAPVLVLFAFCLGFAIWVVVAFHSADFSIVD